MQWKDSLRQMRRTEKLTGVELVRRYVARSHNSPKLPPQAYDGDDPMPLLRRLTDTERQEFKIEPHIAAITLPGAVLHALPPITTEAQPIYTIRVHVICCADDDGGNAFADPQTVSQWIGAGLDEANAIYAAHGAGIRFTFHPGDVELRKSTLLNQDFLVPAGTNLKTGKDTPPLTDDQIGQLGAAHEAERNKVCLQYRDRCVFLLACGTHLDYDAAKECWVVGPRVGYAYSWEDKEFVAFPSGWGALHGPEIAHESGHYFHLWHTHGATPKTVAEASQIVRDYVNGNHLDPKQGLEVFDGDSGSGVHDTPPDPGPDLFQAEAASGANCCTVGLVAKLTVDLGGGASHSYTFASDRGDVMSYFKDCATFPQHFSPDQIKRMRAALTTGNRRRLVATQLGDTGWPHLRYSGLWNAGQGGCVWWPLCTEDELRQKTAELWGSMRLKQMTACVVDGQVRFSCIWEPGTYPQVWWPNCSDKEFRDKTGELWNTMRPAQVHGFVVGNEVRYSCLWNAGTQPQVWWESCSEQQLRDKTGELWATMRPKQMQAFVVGSEVRYSCLWNAGTEPVVWWPSCSEQQFRDKTGELWSSMRPAQLQAFKANGHVCFSAIWRSGTTPQVWWPLCTEEQVRQETGDTWDSMRPAQWMPAAV